MGICEPSGNGGEKQMKRDAARRVQIQRLRDYAVAVVMNYGRFETSGAARLAVFRSSNLMIAYHTPFNPLPSLDDQAKYFAAQEGRIAHLLPYGIDIWQLDVGKVLSMGWRDGEPPVVDIFRTGKWEHLFDSPRQSRQNKSGRRATRARNPATAKPTPKPRRRNRVQGGTVVAPHI